jgi:AcrR family transcriptional regulator
MAHRAGASSGLTAPDGLIGRWEGQAREQVSDIQRGRILAAMVEIVSERDASKVTVALVVARAGVSRRTFYELFPDREACFMAAFDDGVARAARYVLEAYPSEARWAERLRLALAALLTFLDVERGVGWLLVVGSLGAGPQALEQRRRVLAQIITVIDEGRKDGRAGEGPPSLTAEGLAGGVFSLIHARMVDGHPEPLTELLSPLMSMIVLPYLGPAAARRELARPAMPVRDDRGEASGDPLRNLDMRFTYRTMRVLLAIGELAGAGSQPSNRQVADAAGIRDQGQVSKLLTRLTQLGLIENAGDGRVKGEPNQWQLTPRGGEVRSALSR